MHTVVCCDSLYRLVDTVAHWRRASYVTCLGQGKFVHAFVCYAVIKDFGKKVGADNKQVQGLVRLAKKNGEKLGFLA